MTELQLNLALTQVTFCNDVVNESCQGLGREIPPGGPVSLLHEGVRVINGPKCTKITSEHEARTQAVGHYRRIPFLLQPPVYLIVVDHKTSTQITHFRLTSHRIILTYQLPYT
jgi:hypothetical protein